MSGQLPASRTPFYIRLEPTTAVEVRDPDHTWFGVGAVRVVSSAVTTRSRRRRPVVPPQFGGREVGERVTQAAHVERGVSAQVRRSRPAAVSSRTIRTRLAPERPRGRAICAVVGGTSSLSASRSVSRASPSASQYSPFRPR